MISIVERELGRALDFAQAHRVPTLNDITPTMLDDLRRLSPLCVNAYLRFHLREGSEHVFDEFTRDVIRGHMDSKTWGYRDVLVLVPEDDRGQALTMSVEQLRAIFAGIEGKRWACFAVKNPHQVKHGAGASAWGAPGVLVHHVPYFWASPRKEAVVHVTSPLWEINDIPETGLVVAFRRWIALRVSWWAKFRSIELSSATPGQVAEAIGVDFDRVSADGLVALTALIREARGPFDPDKDVRGYTGPDEWFAT